MNKWEKYIRAITAVTNRTNYLYEKWNKCHGINNYVSLVIYMLAYSDISTQRELSACYGMPKQTVNNVINQLKNEGYITLIPDETDKRSKRIALTEAGRKYAEKTVAPLVECEESVLKEMGGERVRMMIDTLTEYADLFEKRLKNL